MANATSLSALTVADINTSVNHEPRILDTRLAIALGFVQPVNIRKLIERHRESLERFGGISFHGGKKIGRGRPRKGYWLNKKQALYLCTKSETERATEVTIQMVEVFDAALTEQTQPGIEHAPAADLQPVTDAQEEPLAFGIFQKRYFDMLPDSYRRGDVVVGICNGKLGIFDLFFASSGRDGLAKIEDCSCACACSRPNAAIVEPIIIIGRVGIPISQEDGK